MFFNMGLNTGKRMLVRAVLEGVAYHKRWILEAMEEKIPFQGTVRFVGGGAKSETWCQIMADIFQAPVAQLKVQEQSALGAVILAGLGVGSYADASEASQTFVTYGSPIEPEPASVAIYDDLYASFSSLYGNVSSVSRSD